MSCCEEADGDETEMFRNYSLWDGTSETAAVGGKLSHQMFKLLTGIFRTLCVFVASAMRISHHLVNIHRFQIPRNLWHGFLPFLVSVFASFTFPFSISGATFCFCFWFFFFHKYFINCQPTVSNAYKQPGWMKRANMRASTIIVVENGLMVYEEQQGRAEFQ